VARFLHPDVRIHGDGLVLLPREYSSDAGICSLGTILDPNTIKRRHHSHHFLPLFTGLAERESAADVAKAASFSFQSDGLVDLIRFDYASRLFHPVFEFPSVDGRSERSELN